MKLRIHRVERSCVRLSGANGISLVLDQQPRLVGLTLSDKSVGWVTEKVALSGSAEIGISGKQVHIFGFRNREEANAGVLLSRLPSSEDRRHSTRVVYSGVVVRFTSHCMEIVEMPKTELLLQHLPAPHLDYWESCADKLDGIPGLAKLAVRGLASHLSAWTCRATPESRKMRPLPYE